MGRPAQRGLHAAGYTAEIWEQTRHMPRTAQGSPLHHGRQLHVDDVPLRTSAGQGPLILLKMSRPAAPTPIWHRARLDQLLRLHSGLTGGVQHSQVEEKMGNRDL